MKKLHLQQFKLHSASPRAIFLLPCNFFPNRTPVHVITYTNSKEVIPLNLLLTKIIAHTVAWHEVPALGFGLRVMAESYTNRKKH